MVLHRRFFNRAYIAIFAVGLSSTGVISCSKVNSVQQASRAVDAYCPYLPSRTFSSAVRVSGTALYEYRLNGNGAASDAGVSASIALFTTAANRTYSITVNAQVYSVQSNLAFSAGQQDVATKLKTLINSDVSAGLYAYGTNSITVTRPGQTASVTLSSPINLTITTTNPSPRPVRFAEIAVKDSTGVVVQCAETAEDGSYSFQLPSATGSYTVELRSRASNTRSNVYVLNNPSDNTQHAVVKTIGSTSDMTGLLLRARVHDGLLGGAFNILDQLLNAQDYLRMQTAACGQPGQPNYFAGCVPFLAAPQVRVYWTPGLSPATYLGTTGSISFYLTGQRELYLQGGDNGNITSSDMDQFDNSVILHEYGHFIEDIYGRPDSPGGSHNGDAIIDPRLAWGEGWANFFQAAVTGNPVYRDTYGTPDCTTACAGVYFNEALDPSGTPGNDAPTPGAIGEGNFREFSVTRALWDVIKAPGGASRFAEIWRTFVETGSGMRVTNDPFKSVGRFHQIQSTFGDAVSWSSIRSGEEQVAGFSVFATPFTLGQAACTTSPTAMTPTRGFGDMGSFATSDLLRNNDFYRFDHAGGSATLELFYSKDASDTPDLDLYVYRPRYQYGRSSDMLMSSAFSGEGCPFSGGANDSSNPFRAQNGCPAPPAGLSSTYGYERSSVLLAPGTYMINVRADTTVRAGAALNYVLLLNGQIICPQEQ